MFRCRMGYWMDFDNPKTFNEKLQWLKLYNRNPFYTTLVDKYAVKEYVANLIGKEYVIPTLGVWNNAKEIDFDKLPNQFVLKTTNGGGGDVVICKDKSKLDRKYVVKHLNQSLKKSIYKNLREWPYKNVPPRIIAEKYMEDDSGNLCDYKFHTFCGEPKVLLVVSDRFGDSHGHYDYFDASVHGISSGVRLSVPYLHPVKDALHADTRMCQIHPHNIADPVGGCPCLFLNSRGTVSFVRIFHDAAD